MGIGSGADQAQQGHPTGDNAKGWSEALPWPTTEGKAERFEDLLQGNGSAAMRPSEGGQALTEDAAPTRRPTTPESASTDLETDTVTIPRQVRQGAGVPAVDAT